MYKKLILLLSLSAVLITMALPSAAQTGAEPFVTNLVLNDDGTLRDGVMVLADSEGVASDYTGEMTDKGEMSNIIDGNDETYWYSVHKYDRPYVILDLGKVYTLTYIRYLPFDGYTDDYYDSDGTLQQPDRYWRNMTQIQLSNYEDFSSYKTVFSVGLEGLGDNEAAEVELESNVNQYRYIRIYRTVGEDYDYPIGIKEISVTGYETFYPQDMIWNMDGTRRDRISVSSPNGGYGDYANVMYVLDNYYTDTEGIHNGGNTTWISNFGETNPYIQIDLGAVRGIKKIRILPFRGTNVNDEADWYFRSGLKIYGSNNPGFEGGGTLLYDQGEYSNTNYAARDTWLETDLDEIMLFRYIKVMSECDVIGITEVKVEGYELFENITIALETMPEIYFTTNGTDITANVINGGDNCLIIAAYEEGHLATVQTGTGTASLPLKEGYKYKAFLWETLGNARPITESVDY